MNHCTPKSAAREVHLPVLPGQGGMAGGAPGAASGGSSGGGREGAGRGVRASRVGWKRALVLTGVWVFMIAHVVQWLAMGTTLAPIEPSESMQTVKDGVITVGAIFFGSALLATALLGRWFCGWGCHWVALQDGTAWLLKKMGVRPKPFRSRLLVWVPFLLAFYMFLWPLFYRFAVAPWLGHDPPWNGFSTHLSTSDFWATFPGVLMAIPFTLVCGAFIIYLVGSKGYCTYACPYGGFFAPVEELAPARIVVDPDKCHQCGHCTAVCTSNVRVHEEVRDYGMVVDPGCMKCMDCVSVCPNGALHFGVGKPSFRVDRRGKHAAEAAARRYDLSWPEEIVFFALAALVFLAVRGYYLQLPLLFASGVAICAVFITWKGWRVLRDANASFHQWQLRFHGRWRPAGVAWVAATLLGLLITLYVGLMNGVLALADHADAQVTVPAMAVFSDQRTEPTPEITAAAERALGWYQLAESLNVLPLARSYIEGRMAWMLSVLGDFPAAEVHLRTGWERDGPSEQLASNIGLVLCAQTHRVEDALAWYVDQLAQHPQWQALRQQQINLFDHLGDYPALIASARAGLEAMPDDLYAMRVLSMALTQHGATMAELEEGVQLIRRTLVIAPGNPAAHAALGLALMRQGRIEDACTEFERAVTLAPDSPNYREMLFNARASRSDVPAVLAPPAP